MATNAAERIGEACALMLASFMKKQSVCMVVEVYFTPTGKIFYHNLLLRARGYRENSRADA
jgi:hypothetical protein